MHGRPPITATSCVILDNSSAGIPKVYQLGAPGREINGAQRLTVPTWLAGAAPRWLRAWPLSIAKWPPTYAIP
jgi:hypothetical protein